MSTKERINNVLKQVKPNKNLEGIDGIIEGGYLDSFELMALITMLSEEFDIEIDISEIIPENFNSIDAITAMVERLAK